MYCSVSVHTCMPLAKAATTGFGLKEVPSVVYSALDVSFFFVLSLHVGTYNLLATLVH